MEGRGLLLCERFESPLDDLFGRAIRPARKLLLQQLLAVRRKTNRIHASSIREASEEAQAQAIKEVVAGQLAQAMKKVNFQVAHGGAAQNEPETG
jgi:23S rRNA maturation mini-RNase III